jgi:phenylacetate-CoA ligase
MPDYLVQTMGSKDVILKLSPYQFKQAAKWVYALWPVRRRYGHTFYTNYKSAQERERWSWAQLQEWQNEHLRVLISHAYRNVPFYQRLFQQLGLAPNDIRTVDDLTKIPTLSKEDVRNNFPDLAAANFDRKTVVTISTSGTSGRPVRVLSEKRHEHYLDGDAYRWRHFGWGGCTPYDQRAALTAYKIPPRRNGQRRLFSYDPVKRLLILSSYDLNRDNAPDYAQVLAEYKPDFMHGFPTALEVLTKFLSDRHIAPPIQPRAIFTQSEAVYPWQRKYIEEFWRCRIFDWYGMEERSIAAAECEIHSGLHVFSDYSIVEILKNGQPVVGEEGEVVSTRLDNLAMPLIRYKTGDIGQLLKEPCPCGRNFPLLQVTGGRDRNFLVTKGGGLISITIVDIPNATEHVEQFQFVQEKPGAVTLKILRKKSFTEHDLRLVHRDLEQKFGDMVDVTIEFVDSLERTARGKFSLLVQKLDCVKG